MIIIWSLFHVFPSGVETFLQNVLTVGVTDAERSSDLRTCGVTDGSSSWRGMHLECHMRTSIVGLELSRKGSSKAPLPLAGCVP